MNIHETDRLTVLWQKLIPVLLQNITLDRPFYLDAVNRYTIIVVDDETGKQEQPYQTIIETDFARQNVITPDDLIGLFLHISSHQRCDILWQYCPTPMDQFQAQQLDLIEEVYNQRLVSVVSPKYYDSFSTLNSLYDQYKGFTVAKRRPIQTMFTRTCNTEISAFDTIHTWLYRCNPLNQGVFNQYMHMWSMLIKDPSICTAIADYES